MEHSTVSNSTMLSVSDESVCITGLDTVAVTGILLDTDEVVVDASQRLDVYSEVRPFTNFSLDEWKLMMQISSHLIIAG